MKMKRLALLSVHAESSRQRIGDRYLADIKCPSLSRTTTLKLNDALHMCMLRVRKARACFRGFFASSPPLVLGCVILASFSVPHRERGKTCKKTAPRESGFGGGLALSPCARLEHISPRQMRRIHTCNHRLSKFRILRGLLLNWRLGRAVRVKIRRHCVGRM